MILKMQIRTSSRAWTDIMLHTAWHSIRPTAPTLALLHRFCFVAVLVIVTFGQMQPNSDTHDNGCDAESNTQRIPEKRDCNGCPHKRCG